jgi:hypothetical protein
MIVPVEDADDAEDAEEESSSCGSSSSVLKWSVSSSSPASSKDGEGGAGYSASLALANCLWRSLMMCWHTRVFFGQEIKIAEEHYDGKEKIQMIHPTSHMNWVVGRIIAY